MISPTRLLRARRNRVQIGVDVARGQIRRGLFGGVDRLIRRDGRNNHVGGGRQCSREFHQLGPGLLRPRLDLLAQAGCVRVMSKAKVRFTPASRRPLAR